MPAHRWKELIIYGYYLSVSSTTRILLCDAKEILEKEIAVEMIEERIQ